jgi:hypothetical protein
MQEISIKQAIERIGEFKGWFYLKPQPWSLESQGFFYSADMNLSPSEEKKVRDGFSAQGWKSTLSKEDIEDLIENTKDQIDNPSMEQIFEAFSYFYENDAYKEW